MQHTAARLSKAYMIGLIDASWNEEAKKVQTANRISKKDQPIQDGSSLNNLPDFVKLLTNFFCFLYEIPAMFAKLSSWKYFFFFINNNANVIYVFFFFYVTDNKLNIQL